MTSLILAVTTSNKEYTDSIVKNIREIYPDENEVEIVLQIDDNVSLGINYNNAVEKAKGDKIILLHNDMVIKPGFVELMNKHISPKTITTYTRIEPPIYNDVYPGKIILDCGKDLETFDKKKFNEYNIEESLNYGGSQLFFGCMKEDYIGIDGYTFKMFCEDDDLHHRYRLLGFTHKVSSAHVYHFVSKTSRSGNYQSIENNSNRNFVRKWGETKQTLCHKYDVGFVIKNCNPQMLSFYELFASNIYVDCSYEEWVNIEQPNTNFNLKERIKNINEVKINQILVEFDGSLVSQESLNIIQQLAGILNASGQIGTHELDIFKIDISGMDQFEHELVELNSPYYLSQTL